MATTKPVALVTGAAQRIGKSVALMLAARGYDIVLHYHRSEKQAEKTAKDITSLGAHCLLVQADLTDTHQVQSLIPLVKKEFKRLDLLVNCASIFKPSGLTSRSLGSFDDHYTINVRAPYILMSAFAAIIKKGHVINFLDTDIDKDQTTHIAYIMSKKSLADLTRLAAVELAPKIRVNAVCPGLILPPVGQPNTDMKRRASKLPLKRRGYPKHINAAIAYLLDNDFVTGEFMYCDGGERLI